MCSVCWFVRASVKFCSAAQIVTINYVSEQVHGWDAMQVASVASRVFSTNQNSRFPLNFSQFLGDPFYFIPQLVIIFFLFANISVSQSAVLSAVQVGVESRVMHQRQAPTLARDAVRAACVCIVG